MASLDDYLSLITAEHNQRPRFVATVALSVQPYVDGSNTALSLIGLFDLDTAVGVQLDALGQWVGITRYVTIDLEQWFTFDKYNVGFDQGKWLTPYETTNETVALDDEHYRLLLRARIASNQWDGTIPGAYDAWGVLFQDTGYQILIQDGLARAERDFSFDNAIAGFDRSIWFVEPPIADIYLSLDSPDPVHGFDEGFWMGPPGTALTQPWARTNGNMHLIEALLGPPLDPITKALFTGGYLGLKSAGVGISYMIQSQPPVPPDTDDSGSGIGLPLFGFDGGPGGPPEGGSWWMSFDQPLGLDQGPLFYPGAHPIDPDFVPPLLTFDSNSADTGLDAGWWTPAVRPLYLELDSAVPEHGLDAAEWYTPGQYWPPLYDPDEALPPTGVTWPPTPLAGFDLGAFAQLLTAPGA
jgi:hypothetical protein